MDPYMLEINEPDSTNDAAAEFTSKTPFMAISKGDTISLTPTRRSLIVTRLRHVFFGDPVIHKICVDTEEAL